MHAPTDNVTPSRPVLMRFLVRSWEYRHPRVWVRVRFACGVFNLGLGVLLLASGQLAGAVRLAGSDPAGGGGADLLDRLPPAAQCPG